MRRCKYLYSEVWVYDLVNPPEYMLVAQCLGCNPMGFIPSDCEKGLPDCYTPVEIDSYWKDIINETNRRLYEDRK